MAILVTGATGYIGAQVLAGLLDRCDESILVLARKASTERLWRALQPHMDFETFRERLDRRLTLLEGDLTASRLGLSEADWDQVARSTDSVIHAAASLNRKSERACLNVNLRGTLEVVRLARRAHEDHGLRRFSFVSTTAVAGERQDALVGEEEALDWERRDYDPYARTKKFGEHMVETLLPEVSRLVFRPSVVLGDSRRPETTQFDMVRAFAWLAERSILPLRAEHRIDIVPVDYVADAIVTLHLDPAPRHVIYHLSAGADSENYAAITGAVAAARNASPPFFWPWLRAPFAALVRGLSWTLRGTAAGRAAARMEVFFPYLTNNTVFDNARVAGALGRKPAPFSSYCFPLLRWSLEHRFRYPYREVPR